MHITPFLSFTQVLARTDIQMALRHSLRSLLQRTSVTESLRNALGEAFTSHSDEEVSAYVALAQEYLRTDFVA